MIKPKPSLLQIVGTKSKFYSRFLTSQFRTLPDFIIIGAAKSGTTSLYNYLTQHHQVLPCFRKEVHYFDRKFNNGIYWYKSHFPLRFKKINTSGEKLISGESSPYYLYHPLSPKRVAAVLPAAKFFIVLRNPVDRAISNYNHRVKAGQEQLPIEIAFEKEAERIAGEEKKLYSGEINFSFEHYYHSYITRGIYHIQIRRWQELFSKEQFLILESSELFDRPEVAFLKVLGHLRLPHHKVKFEIHNKGDVSEYKVLSTAFRNKLIEFYKPHNEKLFELTGMRFDWNK